MIEIHLIAPLTKCLDCGKVVFQHRLGCSCDNEQSLILLKESLEITLPKVLHGYAKASQGMKITEDDFISSDDIINHIEHNTAKIFYNGVEVSRENLS